MVEAISMGKIIPNIIRKHTQLSDNNVVTGVHGVGTNSNLLGLYMETVSASNEVSETGVSWNDIPNMTITKTTGVSKVFIHFTGAFLSNAVPSATAVRIVVDATDLPAYTERWGAANDDKILTIHGCVELSAGEHTIKMQCANGDATTYVYGRELTIIVIGG